MTPLHCAALYGSYDACYLLLEHGANILCKDKESMTPIHFAAREGHFGEKKFKILVQKFTYNNCIIQITENFFKFVLNIKVSITLLN